MYSLKEGLRGFQRAKLSSLISISTIAISLVLMGIFFIITFNLSRFVAALRERVEFEVFIDNSLDNGKILQLEHRIRSVEGVEGVEFIPKEKAALIFQEEFGQEFLDILEENPLPSSFRIKLESDYRSSTKAGKICEKISRLEGVDEVVYRKEILSLLDRYVNIAVVVDFILGAIISIGAIFLVSNTIRLIIMAKERIIETMKLVGATRAFIRRPFIVEGLAQGLIGGSLSAAFVWILVKIINLEIPGFIIVDKEIYCSMLLLGLILGAGGSTIAVRKFLT